MHVLDTTIKLQNYSLMSKFTLQQPTSLYTSYLITPNGLLPLVLILVAPEMTVHSMQPPGLLRLMDMQEDEMASYLYQDYCKTIKS